MLIDALNSFTLATKDSDGDITGDAFGDIGANKTTNVIDLGAAKNRAIGRELYLHIKVIADLDSAGDAATNAFSLITDDNAAMASATTLWAQAAAAQATFVAGYSVVIRVPEGTERYLQVLSTVAVANASAGYFLAYLSPSMDVLHARS